MKMRKMGKKNVGQPKTIIDSTLLIKEQTFSDEEGK